MITNDGPGGGSTTGNAETWNTVVAAWNQIAGDWGLSAGHEVVRTIEDAWWEERDPEKTYDHSQDVERWNLLVTGLSRLKDAAAGEMRGWKIADPYGTTNGLGWGDMCDWVRSVNGWFVKTEVTEDTDLSGGHGTGDYWKATGLYSGNEFTGTVPDSTHGRTERALNGSRGTLKSVAEMYNEEIEAAIASLVWPTV